MTDRGFLFYCGRHGRAREGGTEGNFASPLRRSGVVAGGNGRADGKVTALGEVSDLQVRVASAPAKGGRPTSICCVSDPDCWHLPRLFLCVRVIVFDVMLTAFAEASVPLMPTFAAASCPVH